MRKIVVTRHPGAIAWLRERLGDDVIVAQHVEFEVNQIWAVGLGNAVKIRSGDKVYGVLPVHLIEKILEAGAEYYALVLPQIPPERRGTEISAQEMEEMGAKILRVRSIELEEVVL